MKYVADWTPHTEACGCIHEGTRHVHGVPTYIRTSDFDETGLRAEIEVP